jgi:ATP-dependent Lhr-like helicase
VVWGLSATLGNLDEALHTLVGRGAGPLVRGRIDKALVIDTLLPARRRALLLGRPPGRADAASRWSTRSSQPATTLVFTNTRSQAEIWYQLLLQARPDWAGLVALHHGSLDKGCANGSSGAEGRHAEGGGGHLQLDLGVDFLPVERVLQIGSAKGVARLLQRAGRSGHAPGRPSRITLVPTNTLELVEAAAARRAALAGRSSAHSPRKPLDVLVQHLVTVALGGDVDGPGFEADTLFDEVRGAPAYATSDARRVRLGAALLSNAAATA